MAHLCVCIIFTTCTLNMEKHMCLLVLSQKRPTREVTCTGYLRMRGMVLLFFEYAVLERILGQIHCHVLLAEFRSQHQVF